MAPRTRSGKGLDIEEAAAHRKALRSGPVNTRGLPALPTELLLEIVLHLPTVSFPCYSEKPLDGSYLLRAQLIRALSQMCRNLRRVFLPLAFERIEVCVVEDKGLDRSAYDRLAERSDAKILATELVRQLEIVTIRDPSLARYVKIVNVYIESFSTETVIEELFRCLPLFPTLHTVQFMGTNCTWEKHVQKALEKHVQLPSVTKVLYADYARGALKCFPNAKIIAMPMCAYWYEGALQKELFCIAAHWPNAEAIYGFENLVSQDSFESTLNTMIDLFPKLQTVRVGISHQDTPPNITCLRSCRYLEKPDLPSLIDTAIDILKVRPDSAGLTKSVSVQAESGRTVLFITVNQEGYITKVDDLALSQRLKDIRI